MCKCKSSCEDRIINQFKHSHSHNCVYCGRHLRKHEVTVDHMIPICRGGLTVESNLCIACASCNQEKGCLTKDEYNYFKNTLSEKEYNKQKGLYQEFINNHKNLFYNVTSVMDIEKIQVSKAFTNSTIRNEKIEKVLDYYSTHGEIDKPIVITKNGKLVDGYIRYFVCKMIGLEHIPVTMIN